MIVFDNTTSSGSFSLVLRDKETLTDPLLTLRLTKLDDLSVTEFYLTNTSSSSDYDTFTIDPSSLEQGDYKAEIIQSLGITGDCVVTGTEVVSIQTVFDCNPMDMSGEFVVEAQAIFTNTGIEESTIYRNKARVQGVIYNTVYTYDEGPNYYVYNE